MNADVEIKEEQDQGVDELLRRPVWEDLSDIDERVKEVLQEGIEEREVDKDLDAFMPQIKGLEVLKEGVYAVDMEKTINDMFTVVKAMETQLEKLLSINSQLEKDRNDAKEIVETLKQEKSQLEAKIARMESEMPSQRELQIGIDQMEEERNSVQANIRDQKAKIEKIQKTMIEYQRRIGNLEEEKGDALAEINFLETRLKSASENNKLCNDEINQLKGEKLANTEKIKTLEEELKAALDDRFKLLSELKKSKKAVAEAHSAISDRKLKAKKSFYQSADESD